MAGLDLEPAGVVRGGRARGDGFDGGRRFFGVPVIGGRVER